MVGARSAVFAAMPRLGMIVVDEEHDASYKHESDPRYDARRVAAKRARLEGALVVFGSATPRPESWHGIPRRIALPGRVGGPLPAVEVVDLRHDGGYPLTRPLRDALGRIEDAGGRAILLQNRRGSAAAHPLPVVRSRLALPALRRLAVAARRRPAGLPPLRPQRAPAAGMSRLRLGRPHPDRLRHAGGGGGAGRPVPGAGRAAAGRRRGGAQRRAGGHAGGVPRRGPGGAGGHAAGGQGARRARSHACRGAGRRNRDGDAGLPGRGAHVRPADAAGRPSRAAGRPAGTGADPGLGTGLAGGRAGRPARRGGVSGRRAGAATASSAIRRSGGWCGCW